MSVTDERPARTTPILGLPVPGDGDPADAPSDIGDLADALDTHAGAGRFGWNPGDLKMTGAAAAPSGWLMCNGQAVDRAVYAELFAAIGTFYGGGDGSTSFNVPNLQNTFPIGASGGRPRGHRGGVETVALTWVQSGVNGYGATNADAGDHAHYTSGGTAGANTRHRHGLNTYGIWSASYANHQLGNGGIFQNWMYMIGGAPQGDTYDDAPDHAHSWGAWSGGQNANHQHSLSSRNADQAHENMPPFVAVNMLIKT
jgi:microcystin-dependent protein